MNNSLAQALATCRVVIDQNFGARFLRRASSILCELNISMPWLTSTSSYSSSSISVVFERQKVCLQFSLAPARLVRVTALSAIGGPNFLIDRARYAANSFGENLIQI